MADFDEDNAYGLEGEALVRRYGALMQGGEAFVEVKRKRRPDLSLYVETEQRRNHGKGATAPGGVNDTRAELICYVVADTGWMVIGPTTQLRHAAPLIGRPVEQAKEHNGNPTRGFLVALERLLDRYAPDGTGWPVPEGGWKEVDEI